MSSKKVFVVQELVGTWEDPEIASLVGCYSSLEVAEKQIKDHARGLSEKVRGQICGYEIAFMSLLDEGFQEVYCSIYTSMEQATHHTDSVQADELEAQHSTEGRE